MDRLVELKNHDNRFKLLLAMNFEERNERVKIGISIVCRNHLTIRLGVCYLSSLIFSFQHRFRKPT